MIKPIENQKRIKALRDDINHNKVDADGRRAYLIQIETLLPKPTKTLYIDADSLIYYCAYSPQNVDFCLPIEEGTFIGNKIEVNLESAFYELVDYVVQACKTESLLGNMIPFKDYILVFTPSTNFRYDLFPEYKYRRLEKEESPELKELKKLVKPKGLIVDGVEADDIVAYYARRGHPVASGDKDVIYGVAGNNYFYHSAHRKVVKVSKEDAERFTLLQTLAGDYDDDIPGMPGVALDTAANLLPINGTFEDVLNIYTTRAIKKGKAVEVYRKLGITIKAAQSMYDDKGLSFEEFIKIENFNNHNEQYEAYKELGGLTEEDAILTRRLVGLDQWKGKRRGLKLFKDKHTDWYLKCYNCDIVSKMDNVEDLEHDGDICGTCPKCKRNTIFLECDSNGVYTKTDEGL